MMFHQIFLSPQAKGSVIISKNVNKHRIYKLLHKLPMDVLWMLGNYEMLRKA